MPTANDRFKARFNNWFWLSVSGAAVLHFLLFIYTPVFGADRYDAEAAPPLVVQPLAPELPPPPATISRPAVPIVGDANVDPDVSIPSVIFEQYQPPAPPPPAPSSETDATRAQFEAFVPTMTAPRVLNAAEVERALAQHYPTLLRDAGISGSVQVELWLDEQGRIVRSAIGRSSSYAAMDAAAMRVVDIMKLSPALNRGRAVRVIVTIPIVFNVK